MDVCSHFHMHLYKGTNTNIWFYWSGNGCFLSFRNYNKIFNVFRKKILATKPQAYAMSRNFGIQAPYYPLKTFYLVGTEFISSVGSTSPTVSWQSGFTAKAALAAVNSKWEALLVGAEDDGNGRCAGLWGQAPQPSWPTPEGRVGSSPVLLFYPTSMEKQLL